jgi:hypothetical protein
MECRRLRRRACMRRNVSGCTWGRLRVRRTFACIVGAARDVRINLESLSPVHTNIKESVVRAIATNTDLERIARVSINKSCAARLIPENRTRHPAAAHPFQGATRGVRHV